MKKEHFNFATYMIIDRITGEEVNMQIFIEKAEAEYWEKAYAKTLAEYIGVTGSNSNKVLAYFIKNKTATNLIMGTVRSIALECAVSPMTVSKIIKILNKKGFLKKVRNGCYFLSPELLRHGSKTRGAILIREWGEIPDSL